MQSHLHSPKNRLNFAARKGSEPKPLAPVLMANPAQTLPQFVAQFKSQIAAYAAKFEGGKMPALSIIYRDPVSISDLNQVADMLRLGSDYLVHIGHDHITLYTGNAIEVLEPLSPVKLTEYQDAVLDTHEMLTIFLDSLEGSIYDPENID